MAGSPAAKAWNTTGTRSRTKWACSGVSLPWSCAALSPAPLTTCTTRSGSSLRKTPTVRISGGSRRTMSRTIVGLIWRGDGAKMKPTASAPMATASRASSSLVVPQILTNTHSGYRGGIRVQAIVQVVVVGGEVEEAVARVVEEDHPLGALFLGGQGLVEDGPHGMGGLGGRDGALDPRPLDRGLEHLPLGIGRRLHAPVLDQVAHDRGVTVVAQAA